VILHLIGLRRRKDHLKYTLNTLAHRLNVRDDDVETSGITTD
jgi:hypothetical protein